MPAVPSLSRQLAHQLCCWGWPLHVVVQASKKKLEADEAAQQQAEADLKNQQDLITKAREHRDAAAKKLAEEAVRFVVCFVSFCLGSCTVCRSAAEGGCVGMLAHGCDALYV